MTDRTPPARVSIRRAVAVSVALALLGLTACTTPAPTPSPGGSASSTTTTTAAPAAKTLTIAATAEPSTLDMTALAPVAPAQVQLYNVYETLVKIDGDGKLQPLLAQRWSVSPDRLVYTFYLNPAARFASGTPVTAEAVAQNIERIRTSSSVAPKYSSALAVVSSEKALDPTTLEVTLSRPSNTWLYSMGDTAGMIADPAGFATMGTATAGSGPYALAQWNRGDSIVLERNTEYWGTTPRFDKVTFKYYADPNAMNAAMLAGTIDVISNQQAPDALVQFADTSKYAIIDGGTNGEVTLGLNNSSEALKNIKVRQAIAMAINKNQLLTNVAAGHGTVIGSMVVPTDPYYEDLSGINAYNPTQAKQLLADAGVGTGLTLRLKPAALPYATAAAQQVAADLKAVGIATTIEEQQFPAKWVETVYTKADYDLTIVAHVEARDLVSYTNPNYYWRYNSPTFNALYKAADEAAPDQYAPEMKKAARQLADDAASVWLYMMPNLVVAKATVSGIAKNQTTDSFDVTTIATR
jgi:peptide/nickel transport system substrate-binding protein